MASVARLVRVVMLSGRRLSYVCIGHVYVGVVAWSLAGGCASRRAAKSSGAQPTVVVDACRGGFVLALLCRCISRKDYAFDSGVVFDNHGDVCEVACVGELCVWRGGTRPLRWGALVVGGFGVLLFVPRSPRYCRHCNVSI